MLKNTQPDASGDTQASRPFFHRLTTRPATPRDRLDYWRQFFTAPIIDKPLASSSTGDYQGELLRSGLHEGIAFVNIHADPNVCHFGKRRSDLVLLGYVRSGRVDLRMERGETAVVRPDSGLALFDCDRPVSMTATCHDMSYLALPRPFVAAAMGGDPASRGEAAVTLLGGGLAPILRSHLEAMTVHGEHLDAFEARAAMQAAGALAVALLAGARRQPFEAGMFDDALFAAARRYIELNASNSALTAKRVAVDLGCSRAHLYRVFAERGRTIIGCLRDLRLQRARLLLETRPTEPIGAVAFLCGYTDLSAFGKAFRRRFDMTPGDCRRIARDKPSGV